MKFSINFFICLLTCFIVTNNHTLVTSISASDEQPPNIVLVFADDLGKEWIGCYGAEGIETPHIDALAKSGLTFTNFYCMPQCTPSRLTLLTGQYPFQHGWVNHWDVPRWGGGCHFDPSVNPCLGTELKLGNPEYASAIAGKWQIDDFRQEPDALHEAGFDKYCMWTGYEGKNPQSASRYWNPYVYSDGTSGIRKDKFGPDVFVDFLCDFMEQNRDEPLFLYYPMALPHGPLVHTPSDLAAESKIEKHIAMVRHVDAQVGKLVAKLKELDIFDNTVFIFTTDNGISGDIKGTIGGHEIQGGKARVTENGICVPLVISWPNKIHSSSVLQPGTECDELIDLSDFKPTFLELANIDRTESDSPFEGHSFATLLMGAETYTVSYTHLTLPTKRIV